MSTKIPYEYIGNYRVLEEVGRGGAATVYRVVDAQENCFALKLLHYAPPQDKRWKTRFQREFRLLSRLHHPHLIRVHDFGEDHDRPYYVMDYIDGTNLWTFYRETLRHNTPEARLYYLVPLIAQIVSALDYIHRHRVVHQDLKPANILLNHEGTQAYLVDFGLARDLRDSVMFTQPGFVGTLGYSAPEMVERGRLDGRTDLYSLGVILYTLLADRRPVPVAGRSFEQLIDAIRHHEPVPLGDIVPQLPEKIIYIIERSIQKEPARRFRSARSLWSELLPFLNEYQFQSPPDETFDQPPQAQLASHDSGQPAEQQPPGESTFSSPRRTEEISQPSGEISQPLGESSRPLGEISQPSGESSQPSGESFRPAQEDSWPSGGLSRQRTAPATMENQAWTSSTPEELHAWPSGQTPGAFEEAAVAGETASEEYVLAPEDLLSIEDEVPAAVGLLQSELIGRKEEIARFEEKLYAIPSMQRRSICLFYGASGVGKTFLLEEFGRLSERSQISTSLIHVRPNMSPFGNLGLFLRQVLTQVSGSLRKAKQARALAGLLPELRDVVEPSGDAWESGEAPQGMQEELTKLTYSFLVKALEKRSQVWLFDDLDLADLASQQILRNLLRRLLGAPAVSFMFCATFNLYPESPLPFEMPEHRSIERTFLEPLSEEEERLFVSHLLGQPPTDENLMQIRQVTHGLPMRTMELLHQGSLIARHGTQELSAYVEEYADAELEPIPSISAQIPSLAQGMLQQARPLGELGEETAVQRANRGSSMTRVVRGERKTSARSASEQALQDEDEAEATMVFRSAPEAPPAEAHTPAPVTEAFLAPGSSRRELQQAVLTPVPPHDNTSEQAFDLSAEELEEDTQRSFPVEQYAQKSKESAFSSRARTQRMVFSPPGTPRSGEPDPDSTAPFSRQDFLDAVAELGDVGALGDLAAEGFQDAYTSEPGESTERVITPVRVRGEVGEGTEITSAKPVAPAQSHAPDAGPDLEGDKESTSPEEEAIVDPDVPVPAQVDVSEHLEGAWGSYEAMLDGLEEGTQTGLSQRGRSFFDMFQEDASGGQKQGRSSSFSQRAATERLSPVQGARPSSGSPTQQSPAWSAQGPASHASMAEDGEETMVGLRPVQGAASASASMHDTQKVNLQEIPLPVGAGEAPDEAVLIPLLQQRLQMIDEKQRLELAEVSMLAEEFSTEELELMLEKPREETFDLINAALAWRILETRAGADGERYRFLHPVLRHMLQYHIADDAWQSSSARAARAMLVQRERAQQEHDADLIALRLADGGEYAEAVLWQMRAMEQTLIAGQGDQLAHALDILQELGRRCIGSGGLPALMSSVPPFLEQRRPRANHVLCRVAFRMIWMGLLLLAGNAGLAEGYKEEVTSELHALHGLHAPERSLAQWLQQPTLRPLLLFAGLSELLHKA